MRKVIIALLTSMLCVLSVEAQIFSDRFIEEDTLPQRVVNGLEVVPIKEYTFISGEIHYWKLHVPDFEEKFQHFESRYPGIIDYRFVSAGPRDSIADWLDDIWNKVVPNEIKALVKNLSMDNDFIIYLYIDQEGRVFTVEFKMTDAVLQALSTLPENMMENLYNNLLKENSKTIKQIKFRYSDDPKELGKEYIIEYMDWYFYDQYGITNPTKLDEISKLEYQKSQQQKKKKVDR